MTQTEWRNIPYEQKDLVLSIPYKIGVWLSHRDEQGDVKADDIENEALVEIIAYLAKDKTSTPFVTDVFQDTIKARPDWPSWDCREESVMRDCRAAMDIVRKNVPEEEYNSFREALLTVAEVVAQAYGEFGGSHEGDGTSWGDLVKNALERLKGHAYVNMDRPFNISPAEEEAIGELKKVLYQSG